MIALPTPSRALVGARLLDLRRRRGLFWWSVVLTAGAALVAYAAMLVAHANDPVGNRPPGGAESFRRVAEILVGTGGTLAAVLVGATAGAGDESAGVFRDLVATGRSRLQLFAARLPGALLFLLPLLVLAFGLAVACAVLLPADGQPAPGLGLVAHEAAWLLVSAVVNLVIALGLAAAARSRGITIGVALAWALAFGQLLSQVGFLGRLREGLSTVALQRLAPLGTAGDRVPVWPSLGVALAVLAAWSVVFLAVGAYAAAHREA